MNDATTIKALMIYKVIRRLGLEDERTINFAAAVEDGSYTLKQLSQMMFELLDFENDVDL